MGDGAQVKLTAENTELKHALAESQQLIKDFGEKVKHTFEIIGLAWAGDKLFEYGREAAHAAMEVEKQNAKLNAVLKAQGDQAGVTRAQLDEYTKTIKENSLFTGSAVKEASGFLLAMRNIKGDMFKGALEAAADVATMIGGDLPQAAHMLGKALSDPEVGIMRLRQAFVHLDDESIATIKALVAVGDEATAQKIILKAVHDSIGGAAKAQTETLAGAWEHLMHKWHEAKVALGNQLMPVLRMAIPFIEKMQEAITNVLPSMAEMIKLSIEWGTKALEYMKPVTDWIQSKLVMAFVVAKDVINNFKEWAGLAMLGFQLAVTKSVAIVNHLMGTVMPAYLKWLRDVWHDVWDDIGTRLKGVLNEMGVNISIFWANVMRMMTGGQTNWTWLNLTNGISDQFHRELRKLPEIAAREKAPLEKALEGSVLGAAGKISGRLAKQFEKDKATYDKKMKEMFGVEPDKEQGGSQFDKELADRKKEFEELRKLMKDNEDKKEAKTEDLMSLNKRISEAAASGAAKKAAERKKEIAELKAKNEKKIKELEEGRKAGQAVAVNTLGILDHMTGKKREDPKPAPKNVPKPGEDVPHPAHPRIGGKDKHVADRVPRRDRPARPNKPLSWAPWASQTSKLDDQAQLQQRRANDFAATQYAKILTKNTAHNARVKEQVNKLAAQAAAHRERANDFAATQYSKILTKNATHEAKMREQEERKAKEMERQRIAQEQIRDHSRNSAGSLGRLEKAIPNLGVLRD